MVITKCIYCGSEKITNKVKMYCDSAQNHPLKVYYENPKKSVFSSDKAEHLFADMCCDCGSVVRVYSETPHDNWITGDY
jgi:hypothetical protein